MAPLFGSTLLALFLAYGGCEGALLANGTGNGTTNGTFDVFQYVNQLIGTTNGGHVFAGATLPYGMAKAVGDVNGDNTGGFATDGSNITGFSHMHDSGTGGAGSLGNFALFPYAGCTNDTLDGCTWPKLERSVPTVNGSIVASPGYFGITLATAIKVDMTASNHTSLYRFQFPSAPVDGSPFSPLILLDLTDLSNSRQNGSISVDATSGKMTGNATFLPSFGSGNYKLFFCAEFQGAAIRDTGIWVNSRAGNTTKDLFITRGINSTPLPGGAFTRFEPPTTSDNTILSRVGVSFISSDQACSNAANEIPDWNLENTKKIAETAWREKLTPITIMPGEGVSQQIQTIFWSGIYRTMLNPQDYTGENPLWESTEPYFDSFYCLWDSFRSQLPFLTVLDPTALSRMIRGLLNIYQNSGYLPDCLMTLCKGFTQGGSNADNVIADAYVKGVTSIDWDIAYQAVVHDAEDEPLDWSNEGRGGLTSWKSLNYIPAEDFDPIGFGTMTRSVSRTLEYSYNDFCISTMARGMGKTADAVKYEGQAQFWENLYKADQTSTINGTDSGFTGFFQPKYLNQTFGYQNPALCSNLVDGTCSLQNKGVETFESSLWEYGFFVPGDMAGLVTKYGGASEFVKRLDYLHESGLIYIGNEPSFLTVYQYHYAGRPGKSSYRSHTYIPSYFSDATDGIPGNDDSGAMGSFIAFSMMGLFPNPGQNVYLIIPPYFQSISVKSGQTGKTATIGNVNFDASYQNIYIQSATLDGVPYTKNWIDHSFFLEGKTLQLTLGANESSWGTHAADLPPSLSTVGTNSTMLRY